MQSAILKSPNISETMRVGPHGYYGRLNRKSCGKGYDSSGSSMHALYHRRQAPAAAYPQILGPTCVRRISETVTRFCVTMRLDERKTLQGQPRPCPGQSFRDTNTDVRTVSGSCPSGA